jgi:CheY-like chemotaxis protein
MPKLDGISATSMIRQFDHMTPIISMTSNSKPNEIMTYYSSGAGGVAGFESAGGRCTLMLDGNRHERYITETIYSRWFA